MSQLRLTAKGQIAAVFAGDCSPNFVRELYESLTNVTFDNESIRCGFQSKYYFQIYELCSVSNEVPLISRQYLRQAGINGNWL